MPNDNVSDVFWAAAGSEPLPVAEPETKSSCCGPKPAADDAQAAPATASSCCGPKPAAQDKAKVEAAAAKSSCC